jgi:HK97 family phage prohead protease
MLIRKQLSLSDCQLRLAEGDGPITFEGYASKFGGKDSQGDTILAGAFAYTLRKNGKPKMFYGHEWDMPIGKYTTVKEDDTGLFVKGELTPGLAKAVDVGAALKHGTLDGLSIGGFVKSGDMEELEDGTTIIKTFTRLVEVSPVPFPADANARIDLASVKGEDLEEFLDGVDTVRQLERLLRDAGGFSKGQTAALVARAKSIFADGGTVTKAAEASERAMNDRLKRLADLTAWPSKV